MEIPTHKFVALVGTATYSRTNHVQEKHISLERQFTQWRKPQTNLVATVGNVTTKTKLPYAGEAYEPRKAIRLELSGLNRPLR